MTTVTGGVSLVLVVGAAASPSSPRIPVTGTHVAAGAASTRTWGPARQVAAALNTGGDAVVASVSCGSAPNCTAGGFYTDRRQLTHAFVVSEVNGRWGPARQVAAALNTGGNAQLLSVSCASAGNCAAGGLYTDSTGNIQAFVVNETNGSWGSAKEVAAARNTNGHALVTSVSCASAGNCTAGGYYVAIAPNFDRQQAFVVSEVNGTWGAAREVAGALNTGGGAQVGSVSCASPGNCTAGGYYTAGPSFDSQEAFVVSEVNGRWGPAREVAAALNTGGNAQVGSVSCASAGNCTAGGHSTPTDDASVHQAFVVSETDGIWGPAQVPAAALNTGRNSEVDSVSCGLAGNCTAGGFYTDNSGNQAFVVSETNGTWGTAEEVAAALNIGGSAAVHSVSCPSAGNCSAGGFYTDSSGHAQAFIVSETDGTWGTAEEVAAALNAGGSAAVFSVSCVSPEECGAGGYYSRSFSNVQGFGINHS
jgi:D-alanine-D-alanine ligase-like ATP-grasp enzyme